MSEIRDREIKKESPTNAMNFFRRKQSPTQKPAPLFDEAFLRRLERLNFKTAPVLRGTPTGQRRSRNLRPSLDFSDNRPYTPGDDLRHVDWTAYARHESLFVKLGEATQSVNIHILLDCSMSMACPPAPGQPSVKWPAAVRLAGALSYLALSGGEQLYLTPFAADLAPGFGPTHGKRRAIAALQFLSQLQPVPPAPASTGPGRCLTHYAHTHPGGGLLIIISDLLDTAAPDSAAPLAELTAGLSSLAPPRWQTVVIHLLTQQELHPAPTGDVDLQDIETGQTRPFRLDEATLSQYRLRVRRWQTQLGQTCTQRGAIYAPIQAEWPIEQAIIPWLQQRSVLQ